MKVLPEISDFNSNQNSSVNSVAETLLQRLKTNPTLQSLYGRSGSSFGHSGAPLSNSIDLQKLAASLNSANQLAASASVGGGGNSTRNTSSDSNASSTGEQSGLGNPTVRVATFDKSVVPNSSSNFKSSVETLKSNQQIEIDKSRMAVWRYPPLPYYD